MQVLLQQNRELLRYIPTNLVARRVESTLEHPAHCSPSIPALRDQCAGHQPAQRPLGRGTYQRPRTIRAGPDYRPDSGRRSRARFRRPRSRCGRSRALIEHRRLRVGQVGAAAPLLRSSARTALWPVEVSDGSAGRSGFDPYGDRRPKKPFGVFSRASGGRRL